MTQRIPRFAVAAFAVVLLIAGCGGKRDAEPAGNSGPKQATCEASEGRVTIATGEVGTPVYVIGGGLAQLISDNTKLKATAAETGGAVENVQQLAAGSYDIGLVAADVAADAVTGKGTFDGKPLQVQALTRLYPQYVHLLVRTNAGINSVTDLRGKRVSTGSPKSSTELIARRIFLAAGLDPEKDVQRQRLDAGKAGDAFKSGTIDALFFNGGLPTALITDIVTSMGDAVKFLDVTPYLAKVKEINSAHGSGVIPAATYKQPNDLPTIVTPILLLARKDLSDGNACAITKLIFDKKETLEKVHSVVKEIALSKAKQTDPVTLHPGARQALDALGAG
jgi:uncharacterized protein